MITNNPPLKWVDKGYVQLNKAHVWETNRIIENHYFKIINYSNQFYLYFMVRYPDDVTSLTIKNYGAYKSLGCAISKTNEILQVIIEELKALI